MPNNLYRQNKPHCKAIALGDELGKFEIIFYIGYIVAREQPLTNPPHRETN